MIQVASFTLSASVSGDGIVLRTIDNSSRQRRYMRKASVFSPRAWWQRMRSLKELNPTAPWRDSL